MRRLLAALLLTTAAARAGEVTLTLLHTTDLHAQLAPVTDYTGRTNVGGLARLAHLIDTLRRQDPDAILVDAGDTIQGSPAGFETRGQIMVDFINQMNYHAWTLGNHEWDWGADTLRACLARCRVPVLAANLVPSAASPAADPLRLVRPDLRLTVKGVPVQIVGLTTPGIPTWSLPRLLDGTTFRDSAATLDDLRKRDGTNAAAVRIVVAHQGHRAEDDEANQINAIAASAYAPDVVIGGHSHRSVPAQTLTNGVLFSQAAYWGLELGVVKLRVVDGRVVEKTATTLPVNDTVPEDPAVAARLKPVIDRVDALRAQVVGEAAAVFFPSSADKETPLHNLLCAAIAARIRSAGDPVDAVIHGTLNERAGLKPGPVTLGDLYELVPYENTIGVLTLTRRQLHDVLLETIGARATKGTGTRQLWGLRLGILRADRRITDITSYADADGKPWPDDKPFRVAFNSYDGASGGARLPILRRLADDPACRLKLYDFQTRDALKDYLGTHRPLQPATHGWLVETSR